MLDENFSETYSEWIWRFCALFSNSWTEYKDLLTIACKSPYKNIVKKCPKFGVFLARIRKIQSRKNFQIFYGVYGTDFLCWTDLRSTYTRSIRETFQGFRQNFKSGLDRNVCVIWQYLIGNITYFLWSALVAYLNSRLLGIGTYTIWKVQRGRHLFQEVASILRCVLH